MIFFQIAPWMVLPVHPREGGSVDDGIFQGQKIFGISNLAPLPPFQGKTLAYLLPAALRSPSWLEW